jgi:hypothetical protein
VKLKTEARAAASRINGAKSKGPKTEEGKKISSRNAITHGLFVSPECFLSQEDPEVFQEFRSALFEEMDPETPRQIMLAERVIGAGWRLRRNYTCESQFYHASYLGDECMGALFLVRQGVLASAHKAERHYLKIERDSLKEFRELKAQPLSPPKKEEKKDPLEVKEEVKLLVQERLKPVPRNPKPWEIDRELGMKQLVEILMDKAVETVQLYPDGELGKAIAQIKQEYPEYEGHANRSILRVHLSTMDPITAAMTEYWDYHWENEPKKSGRPSVQGPRKRPQMTEETAD